MSVVWFQDPFVLFDSSKILTFWPTSQQTIPERVNATTRFILYGACIVYVIRRDPRVFIMALMSIAVLYLLYIGGVIRTDGAQRPPFSSDQNYHPDCQRPSEDNPMANVLLTDYTNNPNRSPACYYPTVDDEVKRFLDETIPYDAGRSRSPLPVHQRNHASRQFVSSPVTTIPGDQTGFAEFCYGKKFRPMCRSDQTYCDPNARGVQLEAFGGLESSGEPRRTSGLGSST